WSRTPSRADEPDEKDKTAHRFQQKHDAREHRDGGCERAQLRDEIENDQCIDDREEMPIDQTPQQHHDRNQGKASEARMSQTPRGASWRIRRAEIIVSRDAVENGNCRTRFVRSSARSLSVQRATWHLTRSIMKANAIK